MFQSTSIREGSMNRSTARKPLRGRVSIHIDPRRIDEPIDAPGRAAFGHVSIHIDPRRIDERDHDVTFDIADEFQSTSIREGSMNSITPSSSALSKCFNPHRSAKDR